MLYLVHLANFDGEQEVISVHPEIVVEICQLVFKISGTEKAHCVSIVRGPDRYRIFSTTNCHASLTNPFAVLAVHPAGTIKYLLCDLNKPYHK